MYGQVRVTINFLIFLNRITSKNVKSSKITLFLFKDYYLATTLAGNCGGVMGLKLLPNGLLASVGWDSQLLIWNVDSGTLVRTIQPGYGATRGITILPNSNIVTGSGGQLQIWNLNLAANPLVLSIATDYFCFALEVLSDRVTLAESSGWDIDGYYICTGSCTNIKLRNSNTGTLIKSLVGHTDAVYSLKLLQDGKLASASRDGTIKIWDVNRASGTELVRTMTNPNPYGASLEVLSDGSLACGSSQLNIWNVTTGALIKTLGGSYSAIFGLKMIGSNFLAVASDYSRIDIMDVRLSGPSAIVQILYGGVSWVTAVEILADGSIAYGGSANGCADLLIFRTSKITLYKHKRS